MNKKNNKKYKLAKIRRRNVRLFDIDEEHVKEEETYLRMVFEEQEQEQNSAFDQ